MSCSLAWVGRGTLLLGALIVGGCSSDGSAAAPGTGAKNSSCSAVLSGAITETAHCNMALFQIPKGTLVSKPYIGAGDDPGRFGFQLLGVEPKTGTYTTGQGLTADGTANLPVADVGQVEWNVTENKQGLSDIGDYTLVISGISATSPIAGYDKWELDGTLDATFEPDTSNTQGGEVTLHMEF